MKENNRSEIVWFLLVYKKQIFKARNNVNKNETHTMSAREREVEIQGGQKSAKQSVDDVSTQPRR